MTKDAFFANVDPKDLACRISQDIHDWYHPDWFYKCSGESYFKPPAFMYLNGGRCGINGRHRTILLYRHLDVIPMLLVLPDRWPQAKLREIMLRKIRANEEVDLPDLPTLDPEPIEIEDSEVLPSVDIKINL